jgi:type II secretory pathway component PulK
MRPSTDAGNTGVDVRTTSARKQTSGVVLVAVVVVIAMMSLSAYSFARWMRVEAQAAEMQLRTQQARLAAESAVELTRALLIERRRGLRLPDWRDQPRLFRNIALFEQDEDVHPRMRARFSVLAPADVDLGRVRLRFDRYGISDENAKIELNTWALSNPVGLEQVLASQVRLPASVVRDLMDWINGGTSAGRFQPQRIAFGGSFVDRNRPNGGPLATLDELLLVRGMTRASLYGAEESEAEPPKDSPPQQGAPLSQIGTVHARSVETDRSGQPRIRLNSGDLVSLFRSLRSEFGEPFARWVIALRVFGPGSGPTDGVLIGPSIRAELEGETSTGPRLYPIRSTLDLLEHEVSGIWNGRALTIANPLFEHPSSLADAVARLFDRVTIHDDAVRAGTINVNTASEAVLAILPGLGEQERAQIVAGRGEADPDQGLAWLITDDVLSPDAFRAIEPYVIGRSDVLRVHAIASIGARGPFVQVDAVVDGTQYPPELLSYRVAPAPWDRWRHALTEDDEPKTLPDLSRFPSDGIARSALSGGDQ